MSEHGPVRILVLGASYGLLPGTKLALAGHAVTFVGRPEEIAAIRAAGRIALDIPLRRSDELVRLEAAVADVAAPGHVALKVPDDVRLGEFDFAILAMQEPQFAAAEVARLMVRIGEARLPCLSIMNLPPPPFMKRLGSLPEAAFNGVYASTTAWDAIEPALVSLASPDAQALRRDPADPGLLSVTLASNFKAAPFDDAHAQRLLEALASDLSHLKVIWRGREMRPPVHLLAARSPFAPLAKWPMLVAGNCRCLTRGGGIRSIAAAVHDDVAASREIYEQVTQLARELGASDADLVSFESYAKAAEGLSAPSSAARAISAGAAQVERIDRLVLNLMRLKGLDASGVEPIVDEIEARLAANRRK